MDEGAEGGGLNAIEGDACPPMEEGAQGGVEGGSEELAEKGAGLAANDGGKLIEAGDDDESIPGG